MNNALIYNKLVQHDKCLRKETGHRFDQPAFATISLYSSNNWGAQVYDHNFNKINTFHRYNANHKTIYSSELANHWYGAATTNNYPSSAANRGPGTSMVSHLGHNCLSIANNGKFSFTKNDKPTQATVGTWVHNTTPHLTLNMDGKEAWVSKRSYALTDRETFGPMVVIPGLNDTKRQGTIGYNEKTKVLAILESNGSYGHRLNTWTGVKSPAFFRSTGEFFAQLTVDNHTQTDWCTARPSTGTAEDNYRGIVVVCDNGDVVVTKMIPSKDTYTVRYVKTADGYTVPTAVVWKNNYSTSYGVEQGNQYGIRFQISNNGQYVIAYAPSYYYGSGVLMSITDTKTSKVISLSVKDSSYGYSFAPVGDIDFVMSKSINTDSGTGVTIYSLPLYDVFKNQDDGTEYKLRNPMLNTFDNSYYSTDYSYIVPMTNINLSKFIKATGKLG